MSGRLDDALTLIRNLRAMHIDLRVRRDAVLASPADRVSPAVVRAIRSNHPYVMAALKAEAITKRLMSLLVVGSDTQSSGACSSTGAFTHTISENGRIR